MPRSWLFVLLTAACVATASAAPLSGISEVAAGYRHACALTVGGGILCWGRNDRGSLGTGDTVMHAEPTPVSSLSTGVVAISGGLDHTCALTSGGGVKCWGRNDYGQLGDGSVTDRTLPVDVPSLSSGVISISAGGLNTCALMAGGSVKCWGANDYGQLGNGQSSTSPNPAPGDVIGLGATVSSLSFGFAHGCALLSNGGAQCWGVNDGRQLGYSTPGTFFSTTPQYVDGLSSGVSAIFAGANHVCAIVSGGGAKCWGYGSSGQLGNGAAPYDSPPVDVTGVAGLRLVDFALGSSHTCARSDAGGVKCWGNNYRGQLGIGNTYFLDNPRLLDANLSADVAAIAAGGLYMCAVTNDTKMRCWGDDDDGQLGNGTSGSQQTFPDPQTVGIVAGQSIDFAPLHNRVLGEAPFGVVATASAGLPVTFASLTPSVCMLSGSTVTMLSTGLCTLAANQSGDASYGATTVVRTFAITSSSPPTRLVNLSTRAQVLTGDDVLIGGFVIGVAPKTIVIRAIGPSLASSGVSGALANPVLQLYAGSKVLEANDDWQSGPSAATIQSLGLAPRDPSESALLVTLPPGPYTAIVSASGGTTGIALVEIYEVDREDAPLANISTRAHVGTDLGALIGGFAVSGSSPQSVVITAKGPSLAAYGIAGSLSNPILTLVRQSDNTVIATNDDWGAASNAGAIQASGFAPSNPSESAILVTLEPGLYTAIVEGAGRTTGVGLVEVYRTFP